MNILVLDNYDSFTYNLVHYLKELTTDTVTVFRNDKIDLSAVAEYDRIVLSPGPGVPNEAGIMPKLIKRYASEKAILGVCLGHQAIGEAFGATLENLPSVFHGIQTSVSIIDTHDKLFMGLPQRQPVGRYHSWVVSDKNIPKSLKITAIDDQGQIMAITHQSYNVRGVQFHPESVLTEYGKKMIQNWLENC